MAARNDSKRGESTRNKSTLSHHRSRNLSESTRITLGQRSMRRDSTHRSQHGVTLNTRSYATLDETPRSTHSTRTADLSQRVSGLEKGLTSVNGKLDKLISLQIPQSHTSTPRQPREPSPCRLPRYLDFEAELKKADPNFTTQKGKDMVRDFYVDNPIPRPYMFLDAPGIYTQKDKTAHRDKMTYHEYILAFTTMIRDRRACSPEDWPQLLEHLNQVACDAISRPWPDVRNWSDHVFKRIEKGEINWDSKAEIQYDRMRLSIAPAAISTAAAQPGGSQQSPHQAHTNAQRSITCSDFSARRCRFKGAHSDAGVTYLHNCAWCSAALNLRNTTHNVIDCDNKFGRPQDRQPRGQPPAQPPMQPRQHLGMPPQPFHQQQQFQFQPKRQVVTTAVIQNQNQQNKPKNEC